MLFQTGGQMLFAVVLFFTSALLVVVTFSINRLISKLKYGKLKCLFKIGFEFCITIFFAFIFIVITNYYNYGVIRLYSLIFYLSPIFILLKIKKIIKIKKLQNVKSW